MSAGQATTLWARALADELARCGVSQIVLAPGSRSTPLVLAFAADGRFRLLVHLDERSAAYFALGVGKATGSPAVVVTTSGTAAANLLPAVVEASRSQVPLIVLTADRPHRLRDADANQAIDQVRLYGSYPTAFHDLAEPSLKAPALRHLRAVVCRSVAASLGRPAGPVHINVPLDKPLEPVEGSEESEALSAAHPVASDGRPDEEPFVRIGTTRARADYDSAARLVAALSGSRRGVMVAGPSAEPSRTGSAVLRLAAAAGLPLLADPLSGARFAEADGAQQAVGYDLFLRSRDVRDRLDADLIIRTGSSPTSASLQGWLEAQPGVPHFVIDDGGLWKDHGGLATEYVLGDVADTLHDVAMLVTPVTSHEWRERWRSASDATATAWAVDPEGGDHEGQIPTRVVDAMPSGSTLFVSNSMPVRDLDAFGAPRDRDVRVLGNRGASGIDGIVSTAFGVASSTEAATVCILGDLAFFHDQNGLLWAREADADVVFVLVDNDGGGIFHMLPVREHEPHFTRYFATPHGLDLSYAARMHGIEVSDVTVGGVASAVQAALDRGGTGIVRVTTDREHSYEGRQAAADAVARSVLAALG